MAVTLLTLVNDYQRLLREEKGSSISSTSVEDDVAVAVVNDAMRSVLEEGETWPFDIRRDGFARYYGKKTGTRASFASGDTVEIEAKTDNGLGLNTGAGTKALALPNDSHSAYWTGANVSIVLDDGTIHESNVNTVTDGGGVDSIVIDDGLPSAAAVGSNVYMSDTIDDDDIFPGSCLSRFILTSDGSYGDTSFGVTRIDPISAAGAVIRWQLTLDNTFPGTAVGTNGESDNSTGTWTLFTHELELPATVRRVLSVKHHERRLQLVEKDRESWLDEVFMPAHLQFSDNPLYVNCDGAVSATQQAADATDRNPLSMAIWPAPTGDIGLHYTYAYRHPVMTAATDILVGVPEEVAKLISWRAVQYALESSIENDPIRAARVERMLELRIARARRSHRPMPGTRYIPTPFGGRMSRGGVNPRWTDQVISES